MANDYFVHSANIISAGVRALSAQINNIANEISSGLDKLPTEIQLKEGRTRYAVDTGVANVYVITLPHVPTLTDGFNFIWKATNANTGSSTINVNGLGAKSIILAGGGALISGDIINNQQLWCSYESAGDNFRLLSQPSSVVGGGNAALIALLDESADTTNFIPFANNADGNQALFTSTNLTFNAATGELAATLLTGEIQTAAQPNITSLGSLTALNIDGDLTLTGTVDGIDIATDVAANNAKISYPDAAVVAASKVITDWISVTQAVNLDTMESNIATNNAKVTYPTITKHKTSDTSRDTTTTLVDDPHLAGWTLDAASYYSIKGYIRAVSSSGTPNIKIAWQISQTPVDSNHGTLVANNENTAVSGGTVEDITVRLAVAISMGALIGLSINGFIQTHATLSSTLDLQWAQNTSDGAAVIMQNGSYIEITKME